MCGVSGQRAGLVALVVVGFVILSATAPLGAEKETVNSIGQKFVLIPAGTFMMGYTYGEAGPYNNEPRHPVTISRPFYIQTTEVTQGQWKALMGNNPSYFGNCGDDCPVESVSWHEVREFIARLNAKEGNGTYRLPTEAEWEYAARAGRGSGYGFDEAVRDMEEYAWCDRNSAERTHPVAGKKPNAWGLFDMAGNVWEWCQDWHGDYPTWLVIDPQGPGIGSQRILRGGCWDDHPPACLPSSRGWEEPGSRGCGQGFRLARTPVNQSSLAGIHPLRPIGRANPG